MSVEALLAQWRRSA